MTLSKSAALLMTPLLVATAAQAWHDPGHQRTTRLALAALPESMPSFLADGADTVAHLAFEPDVFRALMDDTDLDRTESPQHYFDLEHFEGVDIPTGRFDMLRWCDRNNLRPDQVGLAPYAIVEWTQRLTSALAEHRAWPDNPHIRTKCLVYAGLLAHYAQDICQPLHTTVHYDGRLDEAGRSPRSGIHQKVDALIGKLPDDLDLAIDPNAAQPLDDLFAGVIAEIRSSHALVDRLYELQDQLPDPDAPLQADSPVGRFAAERARAAATFTARLYATAWRDSASIEMPPWHDRSTEPAGGAPPATQPAAPPATAPAGGG